MLRKPVALAAYITHSNPAGNGSGGGSHLNNIAPLLPCGGKLKRDVLQPLQ
jgi:hypothetical protein